MLPTRRFQGPPLTLDDLSPVNSSTSASTSPASSLGNEFPGKKIRIKNTFIDGYDEDDSPPVRKLRTCPASPCEGRCAGTTGKCLERFDEASNENDITSDGPDCVDDEENRNDNVPLPQDVPFPCIGDDPNPYPEPLLCNRISNRCGSQATAKASPFPPRSKNSAVFPWGIGRDPFYEGKSQYPAWLQPKDDKHIRVEPGDFATTNYRPLNQTRHTNISSRIYSDSNQMQRRIRRPDNWECPRPVNNFFGNARAAKVPDVLDRSVSTASWHQPARSFPVANQSGNASRNEPRCRDGMMQRGLVAPSTSPLLGELPNWLQPSVPLRRGPQTRGYANPSLNAASRQLDGQQSFHGGVELTPRGQRGNLQQAGIFQSQDGIRFSEKLQEMNIPIGSRLPEESAGSGEHGKGKCKPCAWFWRAQGCTNRSACMHCHLCPAGEVKARKKNKLASIRRSVVAEDAYPDLHRTRDG